MALNSWIIKGCDCGRTNSVERMYVVLYSMSILQHSSPRMRKVGAKYAEIGEGLILAFNSC